MVTILSSKALLKNQKGSRRSYGNIAQVIVTIEIGDRLDRTTGGPSDHDRPSRMRNISICSRHDRFFFVAIRIIGTLK